MSLMSSNAGSLSLVVYMTTDEKCVQNCFGCLQIEYSNKDIHLRGSKNHLETGHSGNYDHINEELYAPFLKCR